jgi:lysophospholipase L1-like esterase
MVSAEAQPTAPQGADPAILTRSLVSMGDTARLQHALAKARRGEAVTVAVIGGSITAGAAASKEENRWGDRVAQWWRERFPKAHIKFINAGIGATGSNIAAHRAQAQLLVHKPDFVVAEFAVNDPDTQFAAETLEGLVRQVLRQPQHPAMVLLFTMNKAGGNAQQWHSKIGQHYGLPMVSFRDALWPEIQAGRMKWEDVEADEVHPNDRGHQYCADFVGAVAERVLATLPDDGQLPPVPEVPKPLVSDVFERATMFVRDTITPTRNDGWKPADNWPFGPCWEADAPGNVLEFEVEGTAVSVVYWRIKRDMGMAQAQVDDRPPVKLNGWFEADWGGYAAYELVARDLPPGKHKLRVQVLDEKAPASNGHKFQLQAVMVAGRTASD